MEFSYSPQLISVFDFHFSGSSNLVKFGLCGSVFFWQLWFVYVDKLAKFYPVWKNGDLRVRFLQFQTLK